jgi:hypothetical protein
MSDKLYRDWCFTNFDHELDIETYIEKGAKYVIAQVEKCPTSGKLHLQGYLELNNKMNFKDVKKQIFDNGEHFAQRKGSQKQATDYCRKLETRVEGPWEFGEIHKQGARNDLYEATEVLKHKGIVAVAEQLPTVFVKYNTGLQKLQMALFKNKWREIKVIVYWGEPGTGKTKKVYDLEGLDIYNKPAGYWWDGYNGEKSILLDDFEGETNYTDILKWLDKYPLKLPIKGGFVNAEYEKIYITSNKDPEEWYVRDIKALRRRFTTVEHFE